jgi:hypothetical protein
MIPVVVSGVDNNRERGILNRKNCIILTVTHALNNVFLRQRQAVALNLICFLLADNKGTQYSVLCSDAMTSTCGGFLVCYD